MLQFDGKHRDGVDFAESASRKVDNSHPIRNDANVCKSRTVHVYSLSCLLSTDDDDGEFSYMKQASYTLCEKLEADA